MRSGFTSHQVQLHQAAKQEYMTEAVGRAIFKLLVTPHLHKGIIKLSMGTFKEIMAEKSQISDGCRISQIPDCEILDK